MDKNKLVIIDTLSSDRDYIVKSEEEKIFLIYLTNDVNHQGEVRIRIDGRNSKVQILGIIIGSGKQKIDLYTLQDHIQAQSVSDLLIKSVLFDEAKLNYKGLIKIGKNAQKSNAYQKNQNILMSNRAWADSRPYLEILANDVRCTHGATIGKLDPEKLYYLESRGLSQEQATQLMLVGFFQEITARIQDKNIREELNNKINFKLNNLLTKSN